MSCHMDGKRVLNHLYWHMGGLKVNSPQAIAPLLFYAGLVDGRVKKQTFDYKIMSAVHHTWDIELEQTPEKGYLVGKSLTHPLFGIIPQDWPGNISAAWALNYYPSPFEWLCHQRHGPTHADVILFAYALGFQPDLLAGIMESTEEDMEIEVMRDVQIKMRNEHYLKWALSSADDASIYERQYMAMLRYWARNRGPPTIKPRPIRLVHTWPQIITPEGKAEVAIAAQRVYTKRQSNLRDLTKRCEERINGKRR